MTTAVNLTPTSTFEKALTCIPVVGLISTVSRVWWVEGPANAILKGEASSLTDIELAIFQAAERDPQLKIYLVSEYKNINQCMQIQGILTIITAIALGALGLIAGIYAIGAGCVGALFYCLGNYKASQCEDYQKKWFPLLESLV